MSSVYDLQVFLNSGVQFSTDPEYNLKSSYTSYIPDLKMPYTTENFTSASLSSRTTIQARRSPPKKLMITAPGYVSPDIGSISPLFGGIIEDADIEPFPEFVDPCPPVKAEPLHCILHCQDSICERLVYYGRRIPPCRCGDEVFQPEPLASTPITASPEISLDETIFATIHNLEVDVEMIEIRRDDLPRLMSQFATIVLSRALMNKEFMATMRIHRPHQTNRAARGIVAYVFKLIWLYFDRTIGDNERCTVAPRDLHAVLKMYFSTGLSEWIEENLDTWEQDVIFDNGLDPRMVLECADFGLAGAVSKLWTDCLGDIVRLLIWRDAETRRYGQGPVGRIVELITSWIN
jgi:hypothetical protein